MVALEGPAESRLAAVAQAFGDLGKAQLFFLRSALIVTQGWTDEAAYLPFLSAVPKAFELGGLGTPEILVGAGLLAPGDLDQRPELLDRARQIGQRLVS